MGPYPSRLEESAYERCNTYCSTDVRARRATDLVRWPGALSARCERGRVTEDEDPSARAVLRPFADLAPGRVAEAREPGPCARHLRGDGETLRSLTCRRGTVGVVEDQRQVQAVVCAEHTTEHLRPVVEPVAEHRRGLLGFCVGERERGGLEHRIGPCACEEELGPGPLCTIALWNRPRAAGIAISVETFIPPPDWPKMVTLPGSPSKAAMLSLTQWRASTMSSMPATDDAAPSSPRPSDTGRKPRTPRRWLIVTTTTSPRARDDHPGTSPPRRCRERTRHRAATPSRASHRCRPSTPRR